MSLYRKDAIDSLDRAYALEKEQATERQCILAEAIVYALFDLTDAVRADRKVDDLLTREELGENDGDPFQNLTKLARKFGL
jgi:hypothetical protein